MKPVEGLSTEQLDWFQVTSYFIKMIYMRYTLYDIKLLDPAGRWFLLSPAWFTNGTCNLVCRYDWVYEPRIMGVQKPLHTDGLLHV